MFMSQITKVQNTQAKSDKLQKEIDKSNNYCCKFQYFYLNNGQNEQTENQ